MHPPAANNENSVNGRLPSVHRHSKGHIQMSPVSNIDSRPPDKGTAEISAQLPAVLGDTGSEIDTNQAKDKDLPFPVANHNMMNFVLGGNTFNVDVAAAIGSEVLRNYNTISRDNQKVIEERDTLEEENQTLWEKNKDFTKKNKVLEEENMSLKLLLAQHGISLEEVVDFELPVPNPRPEARLPGNVSETGVTSSSTSNHSFQHPQGVPGLNVQDDTPPSMATRHTEQQAVNIPKDINQAKHSPAIINPMLTHKRESSSRSLPSQTTPNIEKSLKVESSTDNDMLDGHSSTLQSVVKREQEVRTAKRRANDKNQSPSGIADKRRRTGKDTKLPADSKMDERCPLGERPAIKDKHSSSRTRIKTEAEGQPDWFVTDEQSDKSLPSSNIRLKLDGTKIDHDSKPVDDSKSTNEAVEKGLIKFMKRKMDDNKIFCDIPVPKCGKGYMDDRSWRKHVDKHHPAWLKALIEETSSSFKPVDEHSYSHQQELLGRETERDKKREIEVKIMELRTRLEDEG
ncbi:uncharacterized protein LY89DRAFT_257178 [Mollisia scopiformis]|uniref:CWF21 domain-containing protein n=1 Tax=Mollisia scopiformis TaxID=149040 RepID=A0A132BDG9_MOLSC|nr:uncharacterized protein LY89DRAFT_257178 [Mollisia scopiformis]KUJ10303.1 hypothetical protein LY89DRAFT_257178 [Mollisia scopiformis]